MKIHELKCEASYYWAIYEGEKRFEVRKNDRDFKVRDVLHLICLPPNGALNSDMLCTIDYILPGGQFGIDSDYVVMSITKIAISG